MKNRTEVILSILSYSFCSGFLLLCNKLTLHQLPYPSLVVSFQLVGALCFIFGAKYLRYLTVDEIRWKYVVPYLYYIIAFSMGVFCNMKSLSLSNVETVIVFRALSPCVVAFLDAIFLGREYPSLNSWFGLGLIVVGAYGYASFDAKFQEQGWRAYMWPFFYLCIISFEMAYGKRIIRSVDLKTRSGPVVYTNLLGLTPMLFFAAVSSLFHGARAVLLSTFSYILTIFLLLQLADEYHKFYQDRIVERKPIGFAALVLLLMGCLIGTGIGYSSWWCRDKVSATSFTLIGVMNKCLTVLVNLFIWDQHAPIGGILCLLLCLVGGTIYRQSPMRGENPSKLIARQADEVWESDLSMDDREDEETELLENQVADLEGSIKRRA